MKWEERWHPLREEWVIVAAHRQNRPWSGHTVAAPPTPPRYAPDCYLCPGNARVGGATNPRYEGVFVFDNDHPCVGPNAPEVGQDAGPGGGAPGARPSPLRARPARGVARVLCYHPRHDATLAELGLPTVREVVRHWREQQIELGARPEVEHVLVFENKGEVVGVSNPHPHGQIYATNFVFKTIEVEARAAARHHHETGRSLLGDVIAAERADGRRVIVEHGSAIAFLPYFARYAYEVFVAPIEPRPSLAELDERELEDFSVVLSELLVRLDNLWTMPFPYVLALHQAPTDGREHPGFHFHAELHPPLRRPNLLKYLAGPEIGGGSFLSDTWPEDKAEELRATSTLHYKLERSSP